MLSATDAAIIKGMLARGDKQHDIAAHFDQNGARIAEIKSGEKFADVKAASTTSLPPPKAPRFIDSNAPLLKQIEVLLELIRNPPENSRIITFTPALADWVLTERNGANRKLKPARIKRYAESMEAGKWMLTGETIIFSKGHGLLLDGQNRLSACTRSGKKFRSHVVFGIEDAVFTVINTAKARTPSDMFYKKGLPHPTVIAAAVRWLMIYAAGDPTSRPSYSNDEMWEHYTNHVDPDLMAEVVEQARRESKALPRGALAAHLYMFAKRHLPTKRRLAEDLSRNLRGARKLNTVLLKARKNNMGRLNDVWINALIVQTWNAYRAGETVTAKTLKWSDAREYPAIA